MLDMEMSISTPVIETSKTDQLGKLAEGLSKDTCPVTILRRYISEVEHFPVEADYYVFRALSKCNSGLKLFSVNRPISYASIRGYF